MRKSCQFPKAQKEIVEAENATIKILKNKMDIIFLVHILYADDMNNRYIRRTKLSLLIMKFVKKKYFEIVLFVFFIFSAFF